MARGTDDIEAQQEEARRRKRARDLEDFNNEMAGRNTGKMDRFGGPRADLRDRRHPGAASRSGALDPVMAAYLAQPDIARLSQKLELADRASAEARRDLERRRREMLDSAYRDEQGRAIFMNEARTAAYFEDGTKLDERAFGRLDHREFQGRRPAEEWQSLMQEWTALDAHDRARTELRERLNRGEVSPEEARRLGQQLETNMPRTMRDAYERMSAEAGVNRPAAATSLNADELALLDGPSSSAASRISPAAPFPRAVDMSSAFDRAADHERDDHDRQRGPMGPAPAPRAPGA